MGLSKIDSKLLAVRGPGGSVVEVEARVRHSAPSGEGVLYVGDRYKCSLTEALFLSGRGVVRIVDEEVATPPVVIETKESAPDSVEPEAPGSPELPSVADSKDAAPKPKRGRPRKAR